MRKKSVRVILGGGAAYGIAHIGALEVIEKEYKITGIIGTSMGAIIGALYALGLKPQEILALATTQHTRKLFSPLYLDRTLKGIFDGRQIHRLFSEWTAKSSFADVKIPFAAIAYDLNKKRSIIINKGLLANAMRASSSIPYIFAPFELHQYSFVDGGVEHPLPLAFRDTVPGLTTIAVNVLPTTTIEPAYFDPVDYAVAKNKIKLHDVFLASVMQNQAYMSLLSIINHSPEIVINANYRKGTPFAFQLSESFYQWGILSAQTAITESAQKHHKQRIAHYLELLRSYESGFSSDKIKNNLTRLLKSITS